MNVSDFVELILLILILILLTKPLGNYIYHVMDPKGATFLDPVFKPLERFIYRFCCVDPLKEQNWRDYLIHTMGFSLISVLFFMTLLATQFYLPFNPEHMLKPVWDLNFNAALSFMTNTDWQSYGGEKTLSYFSQMTALTVQNFVSPAVGLCAAGALVRGIARKNAHTIGNFWTDLVRITLYLLLPLSIVAATLFISQGVPQNFREYVRLTTLEGEHQKIAQGPIASQEAIKLIGTNGGGFMNANSAHPYENPTPFSNLFQMVLILLIPCAELYYYGKAIGNTKHAWYIFASLAVLFSLGVVLCAHSEAAGNPAWKELGLTGGNWEGKEQRFGIFDSALFACVTTVASCGAVNCCHDCLTPLGGLVPMLNMQLSEVIFGGVGAGLYSILLYVFLAIFISGLIIGRTPEYLGKKIEAFEMKMTVLAVLGFVLIVHLFTAWACYAEWGLAGLSNSGPHGFSEMLYAYSSCAANNGSAFAGLLANTPEYNLTLAGAMVLGRFFVLAPVIALAGSFAEKMIHPKSSASFPISSPIFIGLLIGIIILVGVLTFVPAVTMGPILELFYMIKGTFFA